MKTKIELEIDQETLIKLGKQKLQELLQGINSSNENIEAVPNENFPAPINGNYEQYEIVRPKREVNVIGIALSGGRIKVLKGSRFSKTVAPMFSGSYAEYRIGLFNRGVLNENYELTVDYEFSSMSAGASVILGTQCNTSPWRKKSN